jgi:hypothetical protein
LIQPDQNLKVMKKVFFILVFASLLISEIANCQWYTRRYGVNDLNQLSQQQLTESFMRSRGGARAGALLSVASAIGIGAGIIMFKYDSPYPGDIGRNVAGLLLLAGTIPMEITGLTIWGISGTRLQTIRAVMNNTEVRIGVLNYPQYSSGGYKRSSVPGVSLVFKF